MTALTRDARPPRFVVAMSNPVLKVVLQTPAGRSIRPLALLTFDGRRSGRRISVVVGWHHVDGVPVVVTPASWRANFAAGLPAIVRSRGRRTEVVGTLDADPEVVADAIASIIRGGTSPRALGLAVLDGHTVTTDEVRNLGRALVRFRPLSG